jgi:hypothetical protein
MVIYNFFGVPITTFIFFLKREKSAIVESSIIEFSLLVSICSLIVFFRTVIPVIIGAIGHVKKKISAENEEIEDPFECTMHK